MAAADCSTSVDAADMMAAAVAARLVGVVLDGEVAEDAGGGVLHGGRRTLEELNDGRDGARAGDELLVDDEAQSTRQGQAALRAALTLPAVYQGGEALVNAEGPHPTKHQDSCLRG